MYVMGEAYIDVPDAFADVIGSCTCSSLGRITTNDLAPLSEESAMILCHFGPDLT